MTKPGAPCAIVRVTLGLTCVEERPPADQAIGGAQRERRGLSFVNLSY